MDKVIFYIATEFHYLASVSIINQYYPTDRFKIIYFIHLSPNKSSRLSDLGFDETVEVRYIEYNHFSKAVSLDVLHAINYIKQNEFSEFISFLYHDPFFVFLTYHFKNNTQTLTILAPDGMGCYLKYTSSNLRSRLLNTIAAYKFFWRHKLFFPRIWFTSWNFTENGFLDSVYALTPTLPYNKKQFPIVKFKHSFGLTQIENLKNNFKVSFDFVSRFNNCVLVISEYQANAEYEFKLLETITTNLPDHLILFKKHPNQPAGTHGTIRNEFDLIYIEQVFPVELLISCLYQSIIISGYSNSMMYQNEQCKYFWTYPLLEKYGYNKKQVKRVNPSSHIMLINSFEELGMNLLESNQNLGNQN